VHDCCKKLYADNSADGEDSVRFVWACLTTHAAFATPWLHQKNALERNADMDIEYRSLFPVSIDVNRIVQNY